MLKSGITINNIDDQIQFGQGIVCHWNASNTRILKYSLEMYHKGMKEHKQMVKFCPKCGYKLVQEFKKRFE